jgi:hypothetical protein
MNIHEFSPETLAFLARINTDLVEAVRQAPDGELQAVSQGYRDARQTMSEQDVKDRMLGSSARLKVEPTPRERLLTQMMDLASQDDVKATLQEEIDRERANAELTALIAIADQVGDGALAHKLGGKLADLSGIGTPRDDTPPTVFDDDLLMPDEAPGAAGIQDLESRVDQQLPPEAPAKRGLLARLMGGAQS